MTVKQKNVAKPFETNKENVSSQKEKNRFSQNISSPIDHVSFLQRTIGNQAVQRLLKSGALQAKLAVSQAGDIYEQEADRVAEQVMRMPEPMVQSQPEENGKNEEILQTKEVPDRTLGVAPGLESRIQAQRGSGRSLPKSVAAFFGPRFKYDLANVRIHSGPQADEVARAVNARAFTIGGDVFFAAGQYSAGREGRKLLAHELVHVVQQTGGSTHDSSSIGGVIQRLVKDEEDPRIKELNRIAQEEVDSFWPSYKVLLQCLFTAKKIGALSQLVADLRGRPHKVHGTYFVAVLRNIKSRGSEEILKLTVKMLAKEGVAVHETVEEYPLRFQIADYISGKIDETKKILIGEPKDSIWWVLKATLIETFYTLEEGFVDVLRVGKGSEEAARSYAFEKDAVDRWAGVVKGLGEDFLRLTALYAPFEKSLLGQTQKTIASELSHNVDNAVNPYVKEMEAAAKKALTPTESKSASIAKTAAEKSQKAAKSELSKAGGEAKKIPAKTAQVVVTAEAAKAARSILQKKVKDIKILNELWEEAGKAAKKTPLLDTSKHARTAFNLHRDRFWKAVRKNSEAKKLFEDAGFVFGEELAPVYPGLPGRFGKISLDHKLKISTHPEHALDPGNLEFVIKGDNTLLYHLEKKLPDWPTGKLVPIGAGE